MRERVGGGGEGGHIAALVRSHMNGAIAFESTMEQTTETIPPSPKTITAATKIKQ